jgi:DNA-binding response OmpR family regulator
VRAHLRRSPSEPGITVTRFGDCELDLGRGELRRAGKPVATTPLELRLLELFTRRAGRVLTRRALIDDAWGRDTAITQRVVDNQIANLRKKIEPVPTAPRFLTSVRGIGYRFDLEDVTES